MKGLLILNRNFYPGFPAFESIASRFSGSAQRSDSELEIITNEKAAALLCKDRLSADFIIFWDKDVRLASELEHKGFRLFNSSGAIEKCDDKSLTYLELLDHGIPMPDTITVPKSFSGGFDPDSEFIEAAGERLSYPLVAKECFGSLGEQVYLINDKASLCALLREKWSVPMILQKFVRSSYGKDMRLYVVGGRVVSAMIRRSDRDFRANAALGSRADPFFPGEAERSIAIKACDALGLDFAGVDLLFVDDGSPLLCEVNSNAHFMKLDECSGQRIEDEILSYVIGKCEEKC